VKSKNALGWTPLAEAISLGDRQTSRRIVTFILHMGHIFNFEINSTFVCLIIDLVLIIMAFILLEN